MPYFSARDRHAFCTMAQTILDMGVLDWPPPTVLAFQDWLDDLAHWTDGPPPRPPFE